MHFENARAAAREPADVTGGCPSFGRYRLHAFCAVWKAGDWGLMPLPGAI